MLFEPVMQAVNKWREEKIRKWAVSQGKKNEEEVHEWLKTSQGYRINYQLGGEQAEKK